jgi:hypothetical protein
MSTLIQIKRTTTADLPTANSGTLNLGELAYVYNTSPTSGSIGPGGNGRRLYIGNPSSSTDVPIKIGGQYYTDMMEHAKGTLTADSAIIVDNNKKIDNLKIDFLDLDGRAITSTDTDGDIEITPNGVGKTIISNIYTDATTSLQEYIEDLTGGSIVAGEGIDVTYDDSAGTTTITAETASDSNLGVAKFNVSDFLVTNGDVTIATGGVSNAQLAGSITNAKLSNSTISVAADSGTTNAVDLGDTLTIGGGTGLTSTVSGDSISIALDNTAVTPGSYGSSSAIPTFTVDAQGRLTAAGTASISTTLTIAADDGTGAGGVSLASDTFSILGGEGIDTSVTNDTITIVAETASDTNLGVASFNTNDFLVTNGDVTIKTGGVSNAQLAGSITNAKLVYDYVTIGAATVTLGGSAITDLANLTSVQVDNLTINGNDISSTDTDGNITLTPDGEGVINVPSGYETRTGFGSNSLTNKTYVDQVAQGLDVKESCRVATTANLSATYSSGVLTASSNGAIIVDGVTLSVGDRILVKDQTAQTDNGIYTVTNTGSTTAVFVLTRTPDANEADEITGGAFTFIEEGTDNADAGFVATHNGTPTIGVSNITFEQFSGAGQISAGDALSKTGNTLDVLYDNSSIGLNGNDQLYVLASGITNDMLAGSIANAKLANSTVTISDGSNSNAVDLGDTLSIIGGNAITSTHSTDQISLDVNVDDSSIGISSDALYIKALGVTNDMLAGSIANAKLANSSITINSQVIALGASYVFDTDDFQEGAGATNLWYTTARVRADVGVTASTGLAYDQSSGNFSGVNANTAGTKGVSTYSSSNFNVTAGLVTITAVDGGSY